MIWIILTLASQLMIVMGEIKLRGRGASFPSAVYKNWIPAYIRYRAPYVSLNMEYTTIGSGAGKTAIKDNADIEYAGSDTLLTAEDQSRYPDLVTFPTMAGAVALAYNVYGLKDTLNMTREVVVGIYNGTIRWWNNSLIQHINPMFSFPHHRIIVLARSDKSGTTSLFTEALSSFSTEWKNTYGTFSSGVNESTKTHDKWKPDVITHFGSTSAGIAGILISFEFSIGYLSVASATDSRLSMASIENGSGFFTQASAKTVQNSMDYFARSNSNLTFSLHNAQSSASYPIAGFTHFIVYKTSMTSCASAKELVRYITWFLTTPIQRNVCIKYGMVPLSDSMMQRIQEVVLKKISCYNQLVWGMVLDDIARENETADTWKTVVTICVPLFVVLIAIFSGYIFYQRITFFRRIYNDDWFIPIENITFFYDKRVENSLKSKLISGRSVFSIQSISGSSNYPEMVLHILQWPGKWEGNIIGLRLTTIKQLNKINSVMKGKILKMKDTITHNNIVRFYGLSELENDNYIISEYCAKGQLTELLQNEKFNMTQQLKVSLSFDIAQGMSYLHSKNIIHGGFTSSTCLIDSKWTIKICDWEFNSLIVCKDDNALSLLELRMNDKDDENKFLKHYRDFWTAPEILRLDCKCKPTYASDVYSYAIILQEIYTREDPYAELVHEMNPAEVINAIVQVGRLRPRPPEDMPMLVRQCMEISWSDNPWDRPSFEQILKMIRRSSPAIKTVLDSMMEAIEEYTTLLEENIEERSIELKMTSRYLKNLLEKYIPPHIVSVLSQGQQFSNKHIGPCGIIYIDFKNFNDQLLNVKKIHNKVYIMKIFHQYITMAAEEFSAFVYSMSMESVILIIGLDKTDQHDSAKAIETAEMCLRLKTIIKTKFLPGGIEYSICGSFGKLHEVMMEKSGRYQLIGSVLEKLMIVSKLVASSNVVLSRPLFELVKADNRFKMSVISNFEVSDQTFHLLEDLNKCSPEENKLVFVLEEYVDSDVDVNNSADDLVPVVCD